MHGGIISTANDDDYSSFICEVQIVFSMYSIPQACVFSTTLIYKKDGDCRKSKWKPDLEYVLRNHIGCGLLPSAKRNGLWDRGHTLVRSLLTHQEKFAIFLTTL